MSFSEILENQLSSGNPFALIRLPKENQILLVSKDQKGENMYSFTSFDTIKKYEFRFTDFQEITFSDKEKEFLISLSVKENTQVISKDNYLDLLGKTVQFLQEKKAHKIVISREKWIRNEDINPTESFLFLCKKYPDSFCHLSYWNKEEIWLGATPEVLGIFEDSIFKTMSLAGTLPDEDSFLWGKKEIEEQKLVTEYIREKLSNFSSYLSLNGPNTLHLGHVKHLITYFSVKLDDSSLLSKLIQNLHPTPAVCGIPLDTSQNFILKEEGYNRDFYAGYISLQTPDSEKYFVNLRCGKLYQNGALLFVGGGITAQSNPEKEWEETELKSRFIGESL